MSKTSQRAYLLYDAECGRCTSFMKIAKCFDFKGRIVPVPLQNEISSSLVRDEINSSQVMSSFHMVEIEATGRRNVASGGDGLIELLKFIPISKRVVSVVERSPVFRALANLVYMALARLRGNACRLG